MPLDSRPLVADIYAGVGGLSLGAARAGLDVRVAVELDPIAARAHERNFPGVTHMVKDVAKLAGADLLATAKCLQGQLDGVVGGPPCQGFSVIGKRSLADDRNDLFGHFFRLVQETQPRFFLAENVPGILSEQYKPFVKNALRQVGRKYHLLAPLEIVASELGAPTSRKRVFFVGFDPKRMKDPTDAVAALFARTRIRRVNVGHALAGLPKIRASWNTEPQSWRVVSATRFNDGFFQRVRSRVPDGVGDRIAVERLQERGEVSGCLGTLHTEETIERFDQLRPGQRDSVSKAIRLDKDGLCPTLRAGTGSDRGSYQAVRPIHPSSPRVITPREAARLQGFPDWFQFHPTKWHAFRQIGNSVSPIVAERLLAVIAKFL